MGPPNTSALGALPGVAAAGSGMAGPIWSHIPVHKEQIQQIQSEDPTYPEDPIDLTDPADPAPLLHHSVLEFPS